MYLRHYQQGVVHAWHDRGTGGIELPSACWPWLNRSDGKYWPRCATDISADDWYDRFLPIPGLHHSLCLCFSWIFLGYGYGEGRGTRCQVISGHWSQDGYYNFKMDLFAAGCHCLGGALSSFFIFFGLGIGRGMLCNPFWMDFESTEPILHHFTIFSPRTLRIRGVCFEIVALFPLFPGQNEMATVSAVYSVLGFKLIEATDPGYPQSIPIRQTFWTLAKQSFEVLLFLPATFLPMFWHGSTRWGPDSENPQCYDLRLQHQSEWTRRPYIRHPVAYRVTRTFSCYGLRQSKSFLVWISIDSNSHPNVQWPLHSIQ